MGCTASSSYAPPTLDNLSGPALIKPSVLTSSSRSSSTTYDSSENSYALKASEPEIAPSHTVRSPQRRLSTGSLNGSMRRPSICSLSGSSNRFKRLTGKTKLTEAELRTLWSVFDLVANDESDPLHTPDSMCAEQWPRALALLPYLSVQSLAEPIAARLFAHIEPKDGSGVGFDEFAVLCSKLLCSEPRDRAELTMRAYNTETRGGGTCSRADMLQLVRIISQQAHEQLAQYAAEAAAQQQHHDSSSSDSSSSAAIDISSSSSGSSSALSAAAVAERAEAAAQSFVQAAFQLHDHGSKNKLSSKEFSNWVATCPRLICRIAEYSVSVHTTVCSQAGTLL
jgi:Ca2+-binding EF-hand superfamily protein